MRLGLLLVFAAVPFLEIAVLIKVGQAIGFWPTFLLVLLSAMLGAYVIYEQGLQVMRRAMDVMQRGKPPLAQVVDGLFILLGGALLIVPGFISDAAGIALLVPRLRRRFAAWSFRRVIRSPNVRGFFFGERGSPHPGAQASGHGHRDSNRSASAPRPPAGDGPIIEGEFERIDERTVDAERARNRTPRDGV
jgi:UPF0716 protein FxsA